MLWKLIGKFISPYLVKYNIDKLGVRSRFSGVVTIMGGKSIKIGDDFFSGNALYISTSKYSKISIKDAVMFGPEVMILGGNHVLDYCEGHMRFNDKEDTNAENILIESGAWVGARTVILSGAHIGEGAVVGACSVVNSYVPPYSVAVGNKLRIIKPRFENFSALDKCLSETKSEYTLDDITSIYNKFGLVLK